MKFPYTYITLRYSVLAALCVIPLIAAAQELFPLINTFAIETEPGYPRPHETIALRAVGNDAEFSKSTVSWTADGKRIASGIGLKEATIELGALGTVVTIEVVAVAPDGSRSTASTTISPTEVDLVWDAETYTPAFFHGRALPSAGSKMHLEAIARFHRVNESAFSPEDLVYTWYRNNKVLGNVSGRGKNIVYIEAPVLFGTDVISVIVESLDGTRSGSAAERIVSRDPVLLLYRVHPLFGTLTNTALPAYTTVPDKEATFAAVPYYADASRKDGDWAFRWTVNDTDIAARDDERLLTVRTEDNAGTARIRLLFNHAENWLQSAQGAWNITFEPAAQSEFFNRE